MLAAPVLGALGCQYSRVPLRRRHPEKGPGGGGGGFDPDDGGGEGYDEDRQPDAAGHPASAGVFGPDGRLLNPRVTLKKPEITWLPGVGELEDWRLDVILRVIAASGIGEDIAGPWIRRLFDPDCTFEDLCSIPGAAAWMQALDALLAEVMLDLIRKKRKEFPQAYDRILDDRRKLEDQSPPTSINGRQIVWRLWHFFDVDATLGVASTVFDLKYFECGGG